MDTTKWIQTEGGSANTDKEIQGHPPDKCDICRTSLSDIQTCYDCKTVHGPWAWLCPHCFMTHGVGLGIGLGQKYKLVEADADGSKNNHPPLGIFTIGAVLNHKVKRKKGEER